MVSRALLQRRQVFSHLESAGSHLSSCCLAWSVPHGFYYLLSTWWENSLSGILQDLGGVSFLQGGSVSFGQASESTRCPGTRLEVYPGHLGDPSPPLQSGALQRTVQNGAVVLGAAPLPGSQFRPLFLHSISLSLLSNPASQLLPRLPPSTEPAPRGGEGGGSGAVRPPPGGHVTAAPRPPPGSAASAGLAALCGLAATAARKTRRRLPRARVFSLLSARQPVTVRPLILLNGSIFNFVWIFKLSSAGKWALIGESAVIRPEAAFSVSLNTPDLSALPLRSKCPSSFHLCCFFPLTSISYFSSF